MYYINESVSINKKNKNMIICNRETGRFYKVTEDAWSLVDDFLKSGMSVDTYTQRYNRGEEQVFVSGLLQGMLNARVVCEFERKKNYKIYWDITNDCNLRCIHCCVSAGAHGSENIPFKNSMYMADRIASAGAERVVISGGEPLVHPYFKEIVSLLKQKNVCLTLMTNGTLIDPENASFIKKHFDIVEVSIDGVNEETCSVIRGKGTFEKVMSGIKLLKNAGVNKMAASMLLTNVTVNYIDCFNDICEKNNLHPVIRKLDLAGRANVNAKKLILSESVEQKTDNRRKKLESALLEKRINVTCGAANTVFQVDAYGDIYPCQSLFCKEFKMGNIGELEDIELYFMERQYVQTLGYQNFMRYRIPQKEKCYACNYTDFCFSCPAENYLKLDSVGEKECQLCVGICDEYFG